VGLAALGAAVAVFLASAAAIAAASVQALQLAGRALNPRWTATARAQAAALAIVCLLGLIVAAAGGCLGIGALLYYISRA
jgi:hypothetical protein